MEIIGNLLYTERTKKGLEIEDVEQATGIRRAYLNALEQGKYEILPGEVYVKGFLRNYGNYLGLDGAHLVQLYTDSMIPAVSSQPVTPATTTVAKKRKALKKHKIDMKIFSTIAVVLILVLSAWGLYAWQKAQTADSSDASRNTTVKRMSPATGAVSSTSGNQSSGIPGALSVSTRPVVLIARYSDRCWTSVIADGKTLYEGIPKMDEQLIWEADRQIVVNFGNAGAVELIFNGQPVGKIGERGDVVVKTFTASGAITTGPSVSNPTSAPAAQETPSTSKPPVTPAAPTAPAPGTTPAPTSTAVPRASGVKP